MNQIRDELQCILQLEVDKLYPRPRLSSQKGALRRLNALIKASPEILCILSEPWFLDLKKHQLAWQILCCCARLHLYARVLDDAIDENLPCYREALLRIQPIFWQSVFQLGALSPKMEIQGTRLIYETIESVFIDNNAPSPSHWGRKNHHLLLIPLFLSSDEMNFEVSKNALSDALRILQAAEELNQGSINDLDVFMQLTMEIEENKITAFLAEHGWNLLAWKLCSICRSILKKCYTTVI